LRIEDNNKSEEERSGGLSGSGGYYGSFWELRQSLSLDAGFLLLSNKRIRLIRSIRLIVLLFFVVSPHSAVSPQSAMVVDA